MDTLNEAIKLELSDKIGIEQLGRLIPKNKPRYHFFVFKHYFDGELYNSIGKNPSESEISVSQPRRAAIPSFELGDFGSGVAKGGGGETLS